MRVKYGNVARRSVTGWKGLPGFFCMTVMVIVLALSAHGAEDADPSRRAAAALNAFSVDLFKALTAKDGGNVAVSPYPLARALVAVASGAAGETRRELLAALRLDADDGGGALMSLAALDSRLAAAPGPFSGVGLLLHADDMELSGGFAETAGRLSGVGVEAADFSDAAGLARTVNARAQSGTRGMIGKIVDASAFPPGSRLAIITAAAFAGEWKHPFPAEDTRDGEFEAPEGLTTATYMFGRLPTRPFAVPGGAVELLAMPFRDGEWEMAFLKPENMDDCLDALTPESLAGWLDAHDAFRAGAGKREDWTAVRIPKFSFGHDAGDLTSVLKGLGIRKAFSGDADFLGIAGGERIHLSSAVQAARVETGEGGARAAAAGVLVAAGDMATPDFRLDRPFLFCLRHTGSGALAMLGKVVRPEWNSATASEE